MPETESSEHARENDLYKKVAKQVFNRLLVTLFIDLHIITFHLEYEDRHRNCKKRQDAQNH